MRVSIDYKKDTSKDKMYLNYSFQIESGQLHAFKAVSIAEKQILQDTTLDKVNLLFSWW